ncbi:hypothetical protein V6N13_053930 [Hibiscus sabdariffa]
MVKVNFRMIDSKACTAMKRIRENDKGRTGCPLKLSSSSFWPCKSMVEYGKIMVELNERLGKCGIISPRLGDPGLDCSIISFQTVWLMESCTTKKPKERMLVEM